MGLNEEPSRFSSKIVLRALALFLPIAALIALVIAFLFYRDRKNERVLHELEAKQSVMLQAEIIRTEIKAIESDLLYLANQDGLQSYLADGTPERRRRLEEDYLLFVSRKGIYDQLRYLDETGMEIVRVDLQAKNSAAIPIEQLQDKSERHYFRESIELDRDAIYISPFDFNVEHGMVEHPLKPMLRFATPVFNLRQQRMGVLVLNYLGERPLQRIEEVSASVSGSIVLINEDGYWLHGMKVDEGWSFDLTNDRTFGSDYPRVWQRVMASGHGQFLDAQGLFTFQAVPTHPGLEQAANEYHPPDDTSLSRTERLVTVMSIVPKDVLYSRSNTLLIQLLIVYVIVMAFLSILLWLLSTARTVRKNAQHRLQESEGRLRALSTELLTAQEDERRTMSRDLHDDLGQLATAICLDLERGLQLDQGEKQKSLFRRALEEARNLLDRVHEFSSRLRPRILDDLGLRDAVKSFLGEFESRTGIAIRSDIRFDHHEISPEISQNIYRILQEALNNVEKYAETEEAFVTLRVSADTIELSIEDRGVGIQAEALGENTLGLLGIRERAELLGGTFRLVTHESKGTKVLVSIPTQAKLGK